MLKRFLDSLFPNPNKYKVEPMTYTQKTEYASPEENQSKEGSKKCSCYNDPSQDDSYLKFLRET